MVVIVCLLKKANIPNKKVVCPCNAKNKDIKGHHWVKVRGLTTKLSSKCGLIYGTYVPHFNAANCLNQKLSSNDFFFRMLPWQPNLSKQQNNRHNLKTNFLPQNNVLKVNPLYVLISVVFTNTIMWQTENR